MKTQLKIHPAAQLFPMLQFEELAALAEDIRANGLRMPLVMYGGVLLDGRNRLAACEMVGVEPDTVEYTGDSPVAFVISVNLKRRQLDPSQLACVAIKIEPMFAEEARQRMAMGGGDKRAGVANMRHPLPDAGRAVDQAAAIVGVSGRMVSYAKEIKRESPETFERVKSGEITVNEARRELKQQAARQREDDTRARSPRLQHEDIDIRSCSALGMIDTLAAGSVSLLLTDPPYGNVTDHEWDRFESTAEYLSFMREWLRAMRPKLGPSYSAFVFCDADMTADVAMILRDEDYDTLRQVIWHRPNLAKKRSGSMTFLSAYEPFWHCGNRPLRMPEEWGNERFDVQTFAVPQSTHTEDPSMHPTQKPLALIRRLVEMGSAHGDLVVDPFCGSGTTAVACAGEGRRCITCDLHEPYVRIAKGRVVDLLEHA